MPCPRSSTTRPAAGLAGRCTCSAAATASASSITSCASTPARARRARSAACLRPAATRAPPAIGSTAYVVGGYTGHALARHDRGLPRRAGAPGSSRTFPTALRYAAVAAVGTSLVIAGGSLADGSRLARRLSLRPARRRVVSADRDAPGRHDARRRGLPAAAPCSSSAAGARRSDRSARRSSRSIRAAGASAPAGRLQSARSDLAAVAVGRPDPDRRRRHRVSGVDATRSARSLASSPRDAALAHAVDRPRTSTPPTGANVLTGAARSARALVYVPEQPVEHGRRDRPAHVQGHRPLPRSARCRST